MQGSLNQVSFSSGRSSQFRIASGTPRFGTRGSIRARRYSPVSPRSESYSSRELWRGRGTRRCDRTGDRGHPGSRRRSPTNTRRSDRELHTGRSQNVLSVISSPLEVNEETIRDALFKGYLNGSNIPSNTNIKRVYKKGDVMHYEDFYDGNESDAYVYDSRRRSTERTLPNSLSKSRRERYDEGYWVRSPSAHYRDRNTIYSESNDQPMTRDRNRVFCPTAGIPHHRFSSREEYDFQQVQKEALDNIIISIENDYAPIETQRSIAARYLDKLLDFSSIDHPGPKAYIDQHSSNVRLLRNLNLPNLEEFLLFHIAYRNLPASNKKDFDETLREAEIPTFSKIIAFAELAKQHAEAAAGTGLNENEPA